MNSTFHLLLRLAWIAALASFGCSEQHPSPSSGAVPISPQAASIDAEAIQGRTMSFADRYMTATANIYEQARLSTSTLEGKIMAQRCMIYAGTGAMGNATNPNPVAGMMDMALMVTLSRMIAEASWSNELFGTDNASAILTLLKTEEAEIWAIVNGYVSPGQARQLRALADQWRREHPNQRFVSEGRLADFPQAKEPQNRLNIGQLPDDVFGLARVDPFKGLDPAIQQVKQTRLLAERAFFYSQHMPMLLSWQVDLLYSQMLADSQIRQLFENTTTVAASTTRFSDAAGQFAGAGNRFSETLERFRQELPRQQATLVDQVDRLVARERKGALEQATTQVAALRTTTVDQLNSSLGSQQDALSRHLQSVMNQSIDRAYERLRSLVLIAAGAVLGAVVVYRLIAGTFFGSQRPSMRIDRTTNPVP